MKDYNIIIQESRKHRTIVHIQAKDKFHVMELLTQELAEYWQDPIKKSLSVTIEAKKLK